MTLAKLIHRLLSRAIRQPNGCLTIGEINTYFSVYVGGGKADPKYSKAHKVIWESANGLVPSGLQVMHKCDVRNCIELSHLTTGTPLDNARDMCLKQRMIRKLTHAQVLELRELKLNGASTKELSNKFGITVANVCKTVKGISFAYLPHPHPSRREAELMNV